MDIVKRLAQPRSCPELAQLLNLPTQQVNYHLGKLTEAGLVERIDERRIRGTVEGIYQARAASYWLSPNLVGRLGARKTINEAGLNYLLSLAEDLPTDVAKLASAPEPQPCQLPKDEANRVTSQQADSAEKPSFLKVMIGKACEVW